MIASAPAVSVVHMPTVTSTMDALDDLIARGAADWTVVVADEQTAGLGRAGRSWEAGPGDALLCSILVRPRTLRPRHAGLIALAAGAAAAATLDALGVRVTLKWPNDILLDGRKLAGILIRARADADGLVANVGVGMNLTSTWAPTLHRATLSEAMLEVPDRVALVHGVVGELALLLDGDHPRLIRAAWLQWADLIGESVTVVDGERRISGTMRGVDEYGAIEIEGRDGAVRSLAAGDLVRGPRPVDG